MDEITAACKVVGCKEKDLLKSRLTDEAVVLIVGPVGYKHIVPFEDLDLGPPPVAAKVEAPQAPMTFEGLLPKGVWAILEREDLTDPQVVRVTSTRSLEAIPGLGRAAIRKIREAVDKLG